LLVAAGFVIAVGLAVLSVAHVRLDGFKPVLAYRGEEIWVSHETILVSQTGFPIGQSVFSEVVPVKVADGSNTADPNDYVPRYADAGRFAQLAVLYARLANSDPVERLMFTQGPVPGALSLSATSVTSQVAGPLPMIDVTGMGTSPRAAVAITERGAWALRKYIAQQQVANHVPNDSRVVLSTVRSAGSRSAIEDGIPGTTLVQGHSMTRPLVIFLAVMGLFAGLAFVLENYRPRVRPVVDAGVPVRKSRSA
jgi:hypothetical protein